MFTPQSTSSTDVTNIWESPLFRWVCNDVHSSPGAARAKEASDFNTVLAIACILWSDSGQISGSNSAQAVILSMANLSAEAFRSLFGKVIAPPVSGHTLLKEALKALLSL